jgi:hypothetical protein
MARVWCSTDVRGAVISTTNCCFERFRFPSTIRCPQRVADSVVPVRCIAGVAEDQ